ncbi:Phosphatidylserine decarboxylase proenzyme, mitochondrial [Nymphon striatum]|nr:Phosphatidylserine decarboxylase proenzyme, mitochondrial [Nymphon striatum]
MISYASPTLERKKCQQHHVQSHHPQEIGLTPSSHEQFRCHNSNRNDGSQRPCLAAASQFLEEVGDIITFFFFTGILQTDLNCYIAPPGFLVPKYPIIQLSIYKFVKNLTLFVKVLHNTVNNTLKKISFYLENDSRSRLAAITSLSNPNHHNMSRPTLGYWEIRGMAQPIRHLLTYVGVDFEDKLYKYGPPPEYSTKNWTDVKFTLGLDFPNLPYYIDGDLKITQSDAILGYLGRKHGLYGKNENEKIRIDTMYGVSFDFIVKEIGPAIMSPDPAIKKALPAKLKTFSDFLGTRPWFAGDNISVIDFKMYEMILLLNKIEPGCIGQVLQQFLDRFEALPAIANYMKSPGYHKPYSLSIKIPGKNVRYMSVFHRYLKELKWTPIPLALGFAYISYQHFTDVRKKELKKIEGQSSSLKLASDYEKSIIKAIPFNQLSRLCGWLAKIELPIFARRYFFSWFIKKYNCNMDEALEKDPLKYSTFQEFFGRKLKPDCRVVDNEASITSPSDGTILHFGEVTTEVLEQVKGVSYSFEEFLGPLSWKSSNSSETLKDQLLCDKNNTLYHCVIYLNPGNYHRFHSPTDWIVQYRRHFSGKLLSTMPSFVYWIKDLYILNERVACFGKWKHGFFSMVLVGATNVGSIDLTFDNDLKTNRKSFKDCYEDKDYRSSANFEGVEIKKGNEFGKFNLGSTIVLIFEGPKNMKSKVQLHQKILYGQSLFAS